MRDIRYLNTLSVLIRHSLHQRVCEYYGLRKSLQGPYSAFLKCVLKANASAGQVIEPVENEYIDNALDKGKTTSR